MTEAWRYATVNTYIQTHQDTPRPGGHTNKLWSNLSLRIAPVRDRHNANAGRAWAEARVHKGTPWIYLSMRYRRSDLGATVRVEPGSDDGHQGTTASLSMYRGERHQPKRVEPQRREGDIVPTAPLFLPQRGRHSICAAQGSVTCSWAPQHKCRTRTKLA